MPQRSLGAFAKIASSEAILSIEIQAMTSTELPFEMGTIDAESSIAIRSDRDEDAVADGDVGPFDWMDLRDVSENLSLLIDADKVVLEATEVTLVLSYPLEFHATRLIRPANGRSFTRGELVRVIDETYREVYRLEADSQSSPTPPVSERGHILNRPASDGRFGIWGHDLDDLGIERIDVYRLDGHIWLHPEMVS